MPPNATPETHIIYKTTNLINGKWYIGKHSKSNSSYLGSGVALKKAIKKYGRNNFKRETLIECNIANLDILEIEFIKRYDALSDPMSYNMNAGGTGGNSLLGYTDEQLKEFKSKCSHKGSKNGFFNKQHSQESIDTMIKKKTGMKYSSKRLFTEDQKKEIQLLHNSGMRTGAISRLFNTTGPTILRYIREIN